MGCAMNNEDGSVVGTCAKEVTEFSFFCLIRSE